MLMPHQYKILSMISEEKTLIRYGNFGARIWPEAQKNGPKRKPTSAQGLGMRASFEIRRLRQSGMLIWCGAEVNRGPGEYFNLTPAGRKALEEARNGK